MRTALYILPSVHAADRDGSIEVIPGINRRSAHKKWGRDDPRPVSVHKEAERQTGDLGGKRVPETSAEGADSPCRAPLQCGRRLGSCDQIDRRLHCLKRGIANALPKDERQVRRTIAETSNTRDDAPYRHIEPVPN